MLAMFVAIIKNITEQKELIKFPTLDDLHGAALALARLQSTYKLETNDLANGILGGVKYRYKNNCFETQFYDQFIIIDFL